MTTAFEFRLEERLDNLLVDLDIDETARQAHNVAVVVLAEQLGEWNRRDGRGANAGYLSAASAMPMPVPHTSTPRSASPAETACATFTHSRDNQRKHRSRGHIGELATQLLGQVARQGFFLFKSTMIGGNGDTHRARPFNC